MSDIDLSLARLAADAEQKRAALKVENEALRVALEDCKQLAKGEQSLLDSLRAAYDDSDALALELKRVKGLLADEVQARMGTDLELAERIKQFVAERDLLEQERDAALLEVDRLRGEA